MLFNSVSFAFFLPMVFFLYWFATGGDLKRQNLLLLASSYFFYACWDVRFLFLLVFSTALDYFTGIKIFAATDPHRKKAWLWLSICVNLGFLGVFKYYNFFAGSFADALSLLGIRTNFGTLQVILPVGISFYTFHGLSYVIDLYRGRISPERNFVYYSLFVSFFPLLVAGPIERAPHLLPQIRETREFDYAKAVDGLKQILWGLFKKIVIADNCAEYVNTIFNGSASYSGSTLLVGALLFALQIYCDFSGYSDIALGTARLFGIDLFRNFNFPYFSRDIAEFWRRWHISLSSWFRDYVYIPLGGSRGGIGKTVRNVLVIFLLSGLWHGANWTFLVWGLLNAVYILPSVILRTNRHNLDIVARGKLLPTPREAFDIAVTFALTVFAWIFFRAESVQHAMRYVSGIFSSSFFTVPHFPGIGLAAPLAVFSVMLVVVEWLGREQQYAIARLGSGRPAAVRWALFYCIILAIALFPGSQQEFIYFQF